MKITRILTWVNLVLMSGVWIWATVQYEKMFQVLYGNRLPCNEPTYICMCIRKDEDKSESVHTRLIFVLLCFATVVEILMSVLLIRIVYYVKMNTNLRIPMLARFWMSHQFFLTLVLCLEGLVIGPGKSGISSLGIVFLVAVIWKAVILIWFCYKPEFRHRRQLTNSMAL